MRRRTLLGLTAATATLAADSPAPARATAASWPVTGPDGRLTARLALDADGRLRFGIDGVLPPAPIGVNVLSGHSYVSHSRRTVRERYTRTTGKQRARDVTLAELTVRFAGLDVVVRVSAEGAAYRYVLPDGGPVTGEFSSWTLPPGSPAWLLPYTVNYEATRVTTTSDAAATGEYGFPALFRVGPAYVLLTESDVDGRYDGARLTHRAGSGTYGIRLADPAISATGPLRTPWRVAVVGDLATVTGSGLVDDLAPPSRVADTSWIRPGIVAWSWLTEPDSPADPARQRQYVDFAARHGWPYVLVDAGWSADWVPALVRHARDRGVGIVLWVPWTELDPARLPQFREWGVAGLKIDFLDSDSQARFRFYDEILPAAAAHRLMVNFHGATVPRGMQRTWPHVMTSEAVRGAEWPPLRAAATTVLPYTRNVVGSMDYTPVTWSVAGRDTSDAHELALAVVFESGWQHLADEPAAYEARPEALRLLSSLPAAWDETRLLGGTPGESAVIARRTGTRWCVGGIVAGQARAVRVPLDMLGPGRFTAGIYAENLHREQRIVRRGDVLAIPVVRNGGFVLDIDKP
ncbi:glycoside hydrolase family 97 protein [Actinoplanes sp. RD1]|uniref:glycoside hydrolase family 97 protein n=1 Tax=Actinoplanes sp. RD1 TaxID=3064538 RepID=UPI0027423F77|nr:glycoside hydrolase family 97 protein [Actinoplanes sp. RD1]